MAATTGGVVVLPPSEMAAPAAAADVDVSPADQDVDAFFATIDGEEEMQHEQAKRMYLAEREKRQQIQHMLRDALDAAEVAKRAQLAESEARVAAEKHTEELEAYAGEPLCLSPCSCSCPSSSSCSSLLPQ